MNLDLFVELAQRISMRPRLCLSTELTRRDRLSIGMPTEESAPRCEWKVMALGLTSLPLFQHEEPPKGSKRMKEDPAVPLKSTITSRWSYGMVEYTSRQDATPWYEDAELRHRVTNGCKSPRRMERDLGILQVEVEAKIAVGGYAVG